MIALLLLTFSQYAIAQATIADIREQIAKGECETAQSLYNVYKAMNGTNKTIEREIADCITGSSSSHGGTGTADGHEYVDLGLPSGTLWATCNVGASKPEDYGSYFAWGETQTKTNYNWYTYKYVDGDNLTKYAGSDGLTSLQGGDDPATAKWGGGWHTPSETQWGELLANTANKWTTRNGKQGCLFTSKKNGQTIFLPAAGYRWDSELDDADSHGLYWSRSLRTVYLGSAWGLRFYSGDCNMSNYSRPSGFSVRPVREK